MDSAGPVSNTAGGCGGGEPSASRLIVFFRIIARTSRTGGHGSARDYPYAEFADDVSAAGLQVQHRFGTYELAEPGDDYVVAVLVRA